MRQGAERREAMGDIGAGVKMGNGIVDRASGTCSITGGSGSCEGRERVLLGWPGMYPRNRNREFGHQAFVFVFHEPRFRCR